MPIRSRTITKLLLAAAAAVAGTVGVPVSAASSWGSGSCEVDLSTPFAQFGDTASYFLVPGGSFESSLRGWTASGPFGSVYDNEPWKVASGPNQRAISLGAGASLTTPPVCVSINSTTMRFFLRNAGPADSQLGVTLNYSDPTGKPLQAALGSLAGTSAWAVSPTLSFLSFISATVAVSGTTRVSFTFTPTGASTAWRLDDVYVDPLKHR